MEFYLSIKLHGQVRMSFNLYMPNAGSHNIYHFLIYMLSNLKRLSGDVPDIIYIHIGAKFVEDILRAIYPKTTILDSEKRHTSIFTTLGSHKTINRNVDGISEDYFVFLNNILTPHLFPIITKKKIYLSRDDSKYRRVLNEQEFLELNPDVQKIVLSEYSIFQQLSICNNADIIIAPHGAGLVNTICCRPGTRIIEINTHAMIPLTHFSQISKALGLNHIRYTDTKEVKNIHSQTEYDIVLLNLESITAMIS